MRKIVFKIFVFMVCFFFITPSALNVRADDVSNYSIHISKYQVDSEGNEKLRHDGTQEDVGETLVPVGNVQYTVRRMLEQEDGTYVKAEGADSFVQTLVTDSEGNANLSGLSKGFYEIVEHPNAQVKSPMEPLIVSLPFKVGSGFVNDLYIYPKSNMSLPGATHPKDAPVEKLPNTSGELGGLGNVYYLMAGLSLVGLFGLYYTRHAGGK